MEKTRSSKLLSELLAFQSYNEELNEEVEENNEYYL